MSDISRRALLGVLGMGAVGAVGASWPRLTGADIPGRGSQSLNVAILGNAQDAASRAKLVQAFSAAHPNIKVRIQAVQGADWGDFFAKILPMVAAGTSPVVVLVAAEGAQLFAARLAEPLDGFLKPDRPDGRDYFDDVHPSLVEALMYQGSLFQLPLDFNSANMYMNTGAFATAGLARPADKLDARRLLQFADRHEKD